MTDWLLGFAWGVLASYVVSFLVQLVKARLNERRRAKSFDDLKARLEEATSRLRQAVEIKNRIEEARAALHRESTKALKDSVRGPGIH